MYFKFQVEKDQLETDLAINHDEKLYELQSEKFEVTERLRKAEGVLRELSDALDKEKHKNLALMFSELHSSTKIVDASLLYLNKHHFAVTQVASR